ncbi:MAG: cytochrome P450 [Amphiplicatus sp.]
MTVGPAPGKAIPRIRRGRDFADDHALARFYAGLAPVARTPLGPYIALRYRHAGLLTNPETTRQMELETLRLQGVKSGPLFELFANGMLFSNGAAHKRHRGPVVKTFAFKIMEAMRGEIAARAAGAVEARLGAGPIDFLNEIAGAIPADIIARILGVPAADTPQFARWVYSGIRGLAIHDPGKRAEIERDLQSLVDYVQGLIDARRRRPQDDFLTHYVGAADEAGEMTLAEIRTQIAGLILAGADTTRIAICSTLSQLLQHKEQWRALCHDPNGLKRRAAEEGLRYDPVVGAIPRVALVDLDFDGHVVPAGSIVALSLLSALRDPEVYADPDRFDIFRDDHPKWHLAFGAGAHRCLGEALARAELEETIAAIARLAPNTALVGPPPRLAGQHAVRAVDRMQVAFA